MTKLIAIDFDGTIRDWYTNVPLTGAKDAICYLRERGHKVMIHSCNSVQFIERWMRDNDIPFDFIWTKAGKPAADIYIDDRGVSHRGNWNDTLKETLEMIE